MDSREQILHLMNLYGFTIDTGDFEAFAELFAHGEWTMEGGASAIGKAQLLAGMTNIRLYVDGTPKTRHTTTNIDLIIDEESGTAKSQCYVTVFQQTSDFPLQVIFSGHYFDDFERMAEAWHFKKRLIRYQLVGNMTAHVKTPTKLIENYKNANYEEPDA